MTCHPLPSHGGGGRSQASHFATKCTDTPCEVDAATKLSLQVEQLRFEWSCTLTKGDP